MRRRAASHLRAPSFAGALLYSLNVAHDDDSEVLIVACGSQRSIEESFDDPSIDLHQFFTDARQTTFNLHRKAAARVEIIFAPTLRQLRACLTVLNCTQGPMPMIVLWNAIKVHDDGGEFTVQGIGRTLASLTDSGGRMSRSRIVLSDLQETLDAEVHLLGTADSIRIGPELAKHSRVTVRAMLTRWVTNWLEIDSHGQIRKEQDQKEANAE